MGDVHDFRSPTIQPTCGAHQELFSLGTNAANPPLVAGVPPPTISANRGNSWGNTTVHRRDRMQHDGYAWWVERLRYEPGAVRSGDGSIISAGFEAYWEIPAGAPTAAPGRWVYRTRRGDFFRSIREKNRGAVAYVARGTWASSLLPSTPCATSFGLPGMRILQFAFGDDPKASDYRPHNYPRHCVVYTGTHDNDTTVGWFQSRAGVGDDAIPPRKLDEESPDCAGLPGNRRKPDPLGNPDSDGPGVGGRYRDRAAARRPRPGNPGAG